MRFDEGGILVIDAQACKGLEFDTVVLADLDEHYFRRNDPDLTRRLFYVMIARARDRGSRRTACEVAGGGPRQEPESVLLDYLAETSPTLAPRVQAGVRKLDAQRSYPARGWGRP